MAEHTDFITAEKRALQHRKTARQIPSERVLNSQEVWQTEPLDSSPKLFNYIFALQSQIEQEGPMNYQRYAKRMWSDLIGTSPDSSSDGPKYFENTMIVGLHNIDMRRHSYPGLEIDKLFEKYGRLVNSVTLWSSGDVEATGYQVAKVGKSGVIRSFLRSLNLNMTKEESRKYMKDKTRYRIEDDKFQGLEKDIEEIVQSTQDVVKIVVIDDSRSNLNRVAKMIEDRYGFDRVQFIPVWAAYSREGLEAKKQADDGEKLNALQKQEAGLNAVDEPSEFLDADRFGSIFQEGHVFIDFDGVLGNNITMRVEQARIIYDALLKGAEITGLNTPEAIDRIRENLERLEIKI